MKKRNKLHACIGLGILLIVIGTLMVPLPIHATIAEGEIDLPPPIPQITQRITNLTFVFTTYNSTYSFTVDNNNITVWAEKIVFFVSTSETNGEIEAVVILKMKNCRFEGDAFESHIGKLTLYIQIRILEDKAVCSVETRTQVRIYEIIGNLIR